MSKLKLLTITTIVLLICNIVLIVFLILGKPHHPNFGGPRKIVIEKLQLDDKQVSSYDELIKTHHAFVTSKDEEIKSLKMKLYALLSAEESVLERNEILQQLSEIQKEVELAHYLHFEDIKKLCKDENQLQKFNELSKELSKIFQPKGPPRK